VEGLQSLGYVMDSGTIGVLGGLAGALICGVGGYLGAVAAYDAAETDAQRHLLRQLYWYGGAYAAALMALILLASFGVLPRWVYAAGFVLWFGPLLPAILWLSPRIEELAAPQGRPTASL
jgi:hypothetical protein